MDYFVYFDVYFGIALYLPGKFSGCFAGGGLGMHHSPFTHTHIAHYMSGALYPGLSNLELEGIV